MRSVLYAHSRFSWEDAIESYTCAIALNPSGWVYYYNRAGVYARISRTAEALADYEIAIEMKWEQNLNELIY
jgi:tetratricopeptide (TPR) repeat protein